MQQLTQAGNQAIQELAQRYRLSEDAVRTMLFAVSAGGGTMAQFYHSELGGGGQWMSGGMTMVGDMFNHGLQATVSGLCSELSSLLRNQQVFLPPPAQNTAGGFISPGNAWWPPELGSPSSSGGQNDGRYAYFPQARRLAISRNGQISIYDTLDHQIGGVQQQQSGFGGSPSFSSQFGTFTVDSLPLISPAPQQPMPAPFQPPAPPPPQVSYPPPAPSPPSQQGFAGLPQSQDEIVSAIERLANLHQKGILSDEEFKAKKAELLARI